MSTIFMFSRDAPKRRSKSPNRTENSQPANYRQPLEKARLATQRSPPSQPHGGSPSNPNSPPSEVLHGSGPRAASLSGNRAISHHLRTTANSTTVKFSVMRPMPFTLRRPLLLLRGTLLDRDEPDLAHLRSLKSPERFGWAILPHVARSFAASIITLPRSQAETALVGYLYCRMLDTFEDMVLDYAQRIRALQWFATRFSTGDLATAPPRVEISAADPRQQVHRLLVERHELVDRLYIRLSKSDRAEVAALVTAMASSMQRWAETFLRQGGVLQTEQQLAQYCDDVIGEPARFSMALVLRKPPSAAHLRGTAEISELVQLANVTRDIEHDLRRGIGYHPSLLPYLGTAPLDTEAREQVRRVREELLIRALECVPAFSRLLDHLNLPTFSAARGSAVLLLLFTDRYYRACATKAGHEPWRGANSTVTLVLSSLLSILSRRWTRWSVRRIEGRSLEAAHAIERTRWEDRPS